jgi:hypothetical protein
MTLRYRGRGGVRPRIHWLLGVWFALTGCTQGDPLSASSRDQTVSVDLATCPTLDDATQGKIYDVTNWQSDAALTYRAIVWLRKPDLPAVASCADGGLNDRVASCSARDDSLTVRRAINLQQLHCILADGFALTGADEQRASASFFPAFWEQPFRSTSGHPVPIMLAFEAGVTRDIAERLAKHPFVSRIEPPAGEISFLGLKAPSPPKECPTQRVLAPAKLTGASGLKDAGRKTVIIDMLQDGLLPPVVACPDGVAVCEAGTSADWERAMLSARQQFCVLREIDAIVGSGDYRVDYLGVSGNLLEPTLPPWGTAAKVLVAFGRTLTWGEANKLAAHPYVAAIHEANLSESKPAEGCPLDTNAPIPKPQCSDVRESPEGKWSAADRARWQSSPDAQLVLLLLQGRQLCTFPGCPPMPNPCPEADSYVAYLEQWNWESQQCVRTLIHDVGGTASEERFWLVNSIAASLTWSQIQAVAAHPQVLSVESAQDGSLPP